MRNPLKRLARRDPAKPSLRERLQATRATLATAVRLHRAANAPERAPAVDRVALTNYATFLAWERSRLCAELYPHMGRRAFAFVAGLNAADRFFYGRDGRRRSIAPPASTRALKVLAAVGIDWREDGDEANLDRLHGSRFRDNGERPAVPHNWPAPDAALLEALDDLNRLDRAIRAIGDDGHGIERDLDDVPGWADLDAARSDTLERLATERAECLLGLQAKARAMLTPLVKELPGEEFKDIAISLALNILEAPPRAVEPQPDPVHAVIEKAWRLTREHGRLHAICASRPDADPSWTPAHEAHDAMWEHVRGVLLKTVPTTAEGCKALARFAVDFTADQGVPVEYDSNDPVLALIARSPLL